MESKIFGVSEINNYIKFLLDDDRILSGIFIRGEISNYKLYPSGHHYFTLKDQTGAIRCVMFRGSAIRLRFRPENGMKVIAFGRITVYPRDGAYQLYVEEMTPDGIGDLHVAFEQLKEKLYKEGLFEAQHKKKLPEFPEKIAVITSPAGAAVRDIIRILGKRYPAAEVIVLPVRVQGEEAPGEIIDALKYANKYKIADLVITGRGGGSIEDLWAFNDEGVARAIFASDIPVISAVGHEPDVTIADFVADVRASTPSNGAELAVPDVQELYEAVKSLDIRMGNAAERKLSALRQKVCELAGKQVMQTPVNYIEDKRMLLDHLQTRLISGAGLKLSAGKERFSGLAAKLDAMSPLKVLGRGYAIALNESGNVIKSGNDAKSGDKITIKLQKDSISCTVD